MTKFLALIAATTFGFFSTGNPESFRIASENFRSEHNSTQEILPHPEYADLVVSVFLTTDCKFCALFFENDLVPLKNSILKNNLPVAISFVFLPTDKDSENAIHDLFCVETFSQKWELWIAIRALFANEDIEETVKNTKLPIEKFEKCRAEESFRSTMEANVARAESLGITGVPTVRIKDENFLGTLSSENLLLKIIEKLGEI